MKKKLNALLILLAILVGITTIYLNHFHNEFHFDDAHTIVDNGYIRDLGNIKQFFKDCTTSSSMPSHQGYRPLVTTTLAIDYALSLKKTGGKDGYDTTWYHISNFTWFLLIVIMLYIIQTGIFKRTFNDPGIGYFALIGCAWYGFHTANAETVNYIISRSDILSTLAIVASFAIYIAAPRLRKFFLYLIPVMLGMFAKETTIMFAPALIAYDFLIERQRSLSDLFRYETLIDFFKSIGTGAIALVICLALGAFTVYMTKHHEPGGTSPLWYAASQPYIILHYITQFFFPMGLSADTDIPMVTSLSDDRFYFGLAFLAGLIYLAFRTSKTKEWRPFSFGLIWFLLMLLPTSSFIPLAEVTNDHRVFLPYIGLIIAMVCLVANLWYFNFKNLVPARTAMLILVFIAISVYGMGTVKRNEVWKTDERLWKDVTEKSPNNGRGWMNYGLTLMGRASYDSADYAYQQALKHTPYYYILHINLAVLKDARGDKITAEQYYKNALDYGPNYVEPYYYYGRFLFNNGRVAEAEPYITKGLSLFAGHIYSRYLLMDIYFYNKDWPKLMEAAQTTLAMYPGDTKATTYLGIAKNPSSVPAVSNTAKAPTAADYLNQSLAYYYAKRYRDCIEASRKALEMQPNYAEAYNNICTAYNALEKYDSAVLACNEAIKLKPDFQLAKNNLDWAKKQLKK